MLLQRINIKGTKIFTWNVCHTISPSKQPSNVIFPRTVTNIQNHLKNELLN